MIASTDHLSDSRLRELGQALLGELSSGKELTQTLSVHDWHRLLMCAARDLYQVDVPHKIGAEIMAIIEHIACALNDVVPVSAAIIRNTTYLAGLFHNGEIPETPETLDDCILTYSGVPFHLARPRVEDVNIEDIAHSLANLCRFGGHTGWFYSVAQHSVLVSRACPPELALSGLLHDAASAYLFDVPRSIKALPGMSLYRLAEQKVWACIAVRFGLEQDLPQAVKEADELLRCTESRDLFDNLPQDWRHTEDNGYSALKEVIVPLESIDAEELFLDTYDRLVAHDSSPGDAVEEI